MFWIFFVQRREVVLWRSSAPDEATSLLASYSVKLDQVEIGRLEMLSHHFPSVAIEEGLLFIWGGVELYSLRLDGGVLSQLPWKFHEIQAVYSVGTSWCVVDEIGVHLLSGDFLHVRQTVWLREIVTARRWEKDVLHIDMFDGSSCKLCVSEESLAELG